MRVWLAGVVTLSACQCFVPVEDEVTFDAGETRAATDAGIPVFDAGPPSPFVALNACDWNWRATVRDVGVAAWAFDGPTCALFQFPDAGFEGTFATREECEATCPCDATKLSGDFPGCGGVLLSWADGGWGAFIETEVPLFGVGPGDMAQLCLLTFDTNLLSAECVSGE